jgi:hypothetical protein
MDRKDSRVTERKRLVPYDTHPNFCFAKTSFMLGTLYEIGARYYDS